jgi:hypothetical protein
MVGDDSPLAFLPGATWFSEALLPTAFRSRGGKDKLAESRTSADSVIGHIVVGRESKAGLELTPDGTQLTVIEAKIGSPLSQGTTNAPYFDQAARTVACMAEVLCNAKRRASQMKRLDFMVLAPGSSIDEGLFAEQMRKESIRNKVEQRVAEYKGDLDAWRDDCFGPTVECVQLHLASWEEAIGWVGKQNTGAGGALRSFYDLCLELN